MPPIATHLIWLVTFCLGLSDRAHGEPMSCLDARRECENSDICSLGLIAIEHHCGNVDGRSCEASSFGLPKCLVMLEDARVQSIFADCYCEPSSPQFVACQRQQRLTISNPCLNATASAFSLPSANDRLPDVLTATTASPPGNCFKVIKACKEDPACQQNLQAFYDACPTRKHDTCKLSSNEERAVCRSTHEALDGKLMNCTCEENKAKCKRQRKRIQQNPCTILAPTEGDIAAAAPQRLTGDESTQEEPEEEPDPLEEEEECPVDESNVVIGPNGGYNNGASTCKEALTECTRNTLCRTDFSNYLVQCNPQEIEEYCDRQACRSIVRKFFTDTSPIYTHALVFCHCQKGDIQCETIKRGLNPTCARSGIQNLDCLDLVQSCNEDEYCRSAYRNYRELCKPSDDESGCAYSYGACRAARVAIIGTIMGSSCSCDSNNTDCRYHQKMIFDNSCFDRSDKGYYSSIPPTVPPDLSGTEAVVESTNRSVGRTKRHPCRDRVDVGVTRDGMPQTTPIQSPEANSRLQQLYVHHNPLPTLVHLPLRQPQRQHGTQWEPEVERQSNRKLERQLELVPGHKTERQPEGLSGYHSVRHIFRHPARYLFRHPVRHLFGHAARQLERQQQRQTKHQPERQKQL